MALPLISLLATLAVVASFLVPMVWMQSGEGASPGWGALALGVLAYLVLAYITIFFNAALVHAANERLNGGDPTVRSALRGAASRAGRLLPWALLSATVSALLRALEERAGTLGKIISGIAGIAWSLVTFLVIPVLVMEDLRVSDAVRRSAALFKGTWGENIAARVGFGLLGFLAVLPGAVIIGLAVAAGDPVHPLLVTVGIVWIAAASLVLATLSGIFQTALYRYAAGLPGQGAFASDDLRAAFGAK